MPQVQDYLGLKNDTYGFNSHNPISIAKQTLNFDQVKKSQTSKSKNFIYFYSSKFTGCCSIFREPPLRSGAFFRKVASVFRISSYVVLLTTSLTTSANIEQGIER